MRKILLLLVVVLGTTILAACGGTAQPTAPTLTEITLVATDIAYDKNLLEVVAGQPVKVTLQNEGVLEHDFSIMEIPTTGEVIADEASMSAEHDMEGMAMEPEVHVASPAGTSQSVQFTPSQAGEYEYSCTVAGHKEAGMVGTLVVKNP
jgi:uncharacterized cupredoxin-like copper-binding protein